MKFKFTLPSNVNYSHLILMIIGLCSIISCQKENLDYDQGNSISDQFNPQDFKDVIPTSFYVDWTSAETVRLDQKEYTEFQINYTPLIPIQPGSSSKNRTSYSLLAQDSGENFTFLIVRLIDFQNKNNLSSRLTSPSFVGRAQLLTRKNTIISSHAVAHGMFSPLVAPEKGTNGKGRKYQLNRGNYIWVTTVTRTDWYQYVPREGGGNHWVFTHYSDRHVTRERVYYEDSHDVYDAYQNLDSYEPSGGGNPGSNGDGYDGSVSEQQTIDKIEDRNTPPSDLAVKVFKTEKFKDNDKINCTYEQLLKDGTIKELLTDFFGDDALFDVTLDIGEISTCGSSDDAIGCTTPNADGSYRITIDEEYINDPETPTIYVAQTLLHEAMHANLFAEVKRLNGGTTPADTSFEELFKKYSNRKNWQHKYMAERYSDMMKTALQEVHGHLDDFQFTQSFNSNTLLDLDELYEYISYRGLQNTDEGENHIANISNLSLYQTELKVNATTSPNCNY